MTSSLRTVPPRGSIPAGRMCSVHSKQNFSPYIRSPALRLLRAAGGKRAPGDSRRVSPQFLRRSCAPPAA